jgi:hypothetical protein
MATHDQPAPDLAAVAYHEPGHAAATLAQHRRFRCASATVWKTYSFEHVVEE